MPTSPSSAPSATSGAAGWWCATAAISPATSSPARARWGWSRLGSTPAASTTPPGSGRGSPSRILPPWCRKTPKINEVLPLLYLHGLSTSDFGPALGQFLGSSAGCSSWVITKRTKTWRAEQRAFAARDLSDVDYVYLWVDG